MCYSYTLVYFQQDGAFAHYPADVQEYLDNEFSEQWVSRRVSTLNTPQGLQIVLL